jgi:hypothetical protein
MKKTPSKLKYLWSDRTVRTLIMSVLLITIMGSSRPDKDHGLYPSEYWARKAGWSRCADMVLAGDSRVLSALSPIEMQKYFPGARIYNYGFGGAWFSKQYMDKVEELLDPKAKDKTVIMGISPHSLTKRDAETGNFYEIHSLSDRDKFMHIHFASLMRFFDPLSFSAAIDGTFPSLAESHTERTFFADGWIAVHKEPSSIKHAIKKYAGFYKERVVDPCNVKNVIKYVKKWTSQGIEVYGFIPPSCKEMYELEAAVSGLDQQEFINKFEAAGGVWIETDPAAYHTFDGSHLQDDAALQLTRDFVAEMKKVQEEKSPLTVKK